MNTYGVVYMFFASEIYNPCGLVNSGFVACDIVTAETADDAVTMVEGMHDGDVLYVKTLKPQGYTGPQSYRGPQDHHLTAELHRTAELYRNATYFGPQRTRTA